MKPESEGPSGNQRASGQEKQKESRGSFAGTSEELYPPSHCSRNPFRRGHSFCRLHAEMAGSHEKHDPAHDLRKLSGNGRAHYRSLFPQTQHQAGRAESHRSTGFYAKQLERVKPNTVIHYHANIHKALKYAVKIDLIPSNPADKVERPKKDDFKGSYYTAEEIHALTEAAYGTKLEIPVLLASFYGLRRSEVLGLKWDAIDFEANTMEVKRIVTQASIDGKKVLVQADRAKTKSSLRTLPLVPPIRDRLLELKGQQETYRRLCRSSYNPDYLGYLCVDEIGNILRPNYVSEQFPKLLEKNGLRPIRFHDLRHSCASLLLANGVPMKQIQEWLGHSDFSTTANIYAHLDYASKLSSAQAMLECLGYGNASA